MGIRFHMWKLIYNSIFSKDKPLKNMIILEFFQFPSQVIKYLNNPSIHSVSIQNLKIFSKSRIKIFICTGSAKYFFFLENALKKTTEYFLTKLKKNVRLRTLYISFKLQKNICNCILLKESVKNKFTILAVVRYNVRI